MHFVRTNVKERENGIITFTREITWLGLINHGWGNGYFALPKSHKWYGQDYDSVPLDVHYGLTFSQEEEINGTTYWVIGFDTAHFGDTMDKWTQENVVEYVDDIFENQLKELTVS